YALPRLGGHTAKLGVSLERFDIRYAIRNPGAASGAFVDADAGDPGSGITVLDIAYRPTVLAGFVQDQWWVNRSLVLRGGVRAERVGSASFQALSPRGSFKLFLSPDHAITGSAGRYHQVVQ